MLERFGGDSARVAAMQARLRQIGLSEGIVFAFASRIGRTRDSHRLVALAREVGGAEAQQRVVDVLFARYFEASGEGGQGIDITSLDDLAAAGAAAGLGGGKAEEVKRLLEGKEGERAGREVDEEVRWATTELGVRGVPFFEIRAGEGEGEVDGAQDVPAFLEVFARVKAMEEGGRWSLARTRGLLTVRLVSRAGTPVHFAIASYVDQARF